MSFDNNPSTAQKDAWKRSKLIEIDDLSFSKTIIEKNHNQEVEFNGLKYIGGVDISFIENNVEDAVASLVVLEYPNLTVCIQMIRTLTTLLGMVKDLPTFICE
ncbi:3104_t:CDS:2 [Gigaspora rosea]|nr:3104_t:CDS:2 [Gigaspora rosea]